VILRDSAQRGPAAGAWARIAATAAGVCAAGLLIGCGNEPAEPAMAGTDAPRSPLAKVWASLTGRGADGSADPNDPNAPGDPDAAAREPGKPLKTVPGAPENIAFNTPPRAAPRSLAAQRKYNKLMAEAQAAMRREQWRKAIDRLRKARKVANTPEVHSLLAVAEARKQAEPKSWLSRLLGR